MAVCVGDLGKGLVEDGDVVSGGVGTGVAGPEQCGQGFAGVVQEAQQWVVAEAALVGGRRLLLLGVAGNQGGVEVQDKTGQVASARAGCGYPCPGLGGLQPCDLPGGGPGRAQAGECSRVDAGQQAPGGRRGGDGAEHLRLVAQQGQVRYRIAAVGEHDREIDRDPDGIVPGATRSQPTECVREGAGQASDIGEIGQQAGSGVTGHPVTVGRHDELGTRPGRVHAESAFLL